MMVLKSGKLYIITVFQRLIFIVNSKRLLSMRNPLIPFCTKPLLVFHQKRPMVMHTAKQEKCQILWMDPSAQDLTSGEKSLWEWTPMQNFWNSTFSCTVQWCMQICHKPFFHQLRATWKCYFTIFYIFKIRIIIRI